MPVEAASTPEPESLSTLVDADDVSKVGTSDGDGGEIPHQTVTPGNTPQGTGTIVPAAVALSPIGDTLPTNEAEIGTVVPARESLPDEGRT